MAFTHIKDLDFYSLNKLDDKDLEYIVKQREEREIFVITMNSGKEELLADTVKIY